MDVFIEVLLIVGGRSTFSITAATPEKAEGVDRDLSYRDFVEACGVMAEEIRAADEILVARLAYTDQDRSPSALYRALIEQVAYRKLEAYLPWEFDGLPWVERALAGYAHQMADRYFRWYPIP